MKRKKTQCLLVLFAVGSLVAESNPDQASNPSTTYPKNSKGEITVQGCLAKATGDYILVQTDPGNTFKLEKGNRNIKLGPHLGEQVVVTGWKSAALSTSSDALNRAGSPSSVTLMVTSVRTLAKECTVREVTGSAVSGAVTEAELELSSTPGDADIEIDGKFVGDTVSTISIAAGEHKLVVKKIGYKPWEKAISVTGGRVKVHADLQPESK